MSSFDLLLRNVEVGLPGGRVRGVRLALLSFALRDSDTSDNVRKCVGTQHAKVRNVCFI